MISSVSPASISWQCCGDFLFPSSAFGETGDGLGSSGEGRTQGKAGESTFFRPEVKYLGHVMSEQGVAIDPGKIKAFAWCCPETVSELRTFLGFASYYRHFVKGFAKLVAPLHRLVAGVMGGKSGKRRGQSLTHAWTEQRQHLRP